MYEFLPHYRFVDFGSIFRLNLVNMSWTDVAFATVCLVAIALAIDSGFDRQLKFDCYKLKNQTGMKGFYITSYEKDACDSVNISVAAPVL